MLSWQPLALLKVNFLRLLVLSAPVPGSVNVAELLQTALIVSPLSY